MYWKHISLMRLIKNCNEITAPDDLEKNQKAIQKAIETNSVETVEKSFILKNNKFLNNFKVSSRSFIEFLNIGLSLFLDVSLDIRLSCVFNKSVA